MKTLQDIHEAREAGDSETVKELRTALKESGIELPHPKKKGDRDGKGHHGEDDSDQD